MGKKIRAAASAFVLAAVVLAFGAGAVKNIYINGEPTALTGDIFAVGSGGVGALSEGELYALTAEGLERIGGSAAPSGQFGAGLVYDDGSVSIPYTTLFVGLRYYYSAARNTTLGSANLENAVGSGYELGYYDYNRVFHPVGRTQERQLTMRPTEDNGVGVYITGTDTLLYECPYTGVNCMVGVRPLCDGDAVTWFAGKRYNGSFAYSVQGGGLTVVNVVDIERYVMGVCASEMGESWPVEALKAQAVAARTYAANYVNRSVYYNSCGFDLTGDTYCQAYSGCGSVGANITEAVTATVGQYVTYNGSLCDVQYFSSDGGGTEDNINVNGNSSHPYLRGVIDPYEAMTDSINYYSSWTVEMTPQQLGAKVGIGSVTDARTELSATGNVIKLTLTDTEGRQAVAERDACRTRLGVPSLRYSVSQTAAGFVFTGSGWGHSLGMSQYGAYAMAAYYGATYKDILGFYYTGVGLSYGA